LNEYKHIKERLQGLVEEYHAILNKYSEQSRKPIDDPIFKYRRGYIWGIKRAIDEIEEIEEFEHKWYD
jgi:hypothetical protein